MTRWFTSDWHIGHRNIIAYCNRPYADVDAMARDLIARHNAVVAPADEVWNLGDFVFGGVTRGAAILSQLNGIQRLVVGNHERGREQMMRMGFVEAVRGPIDDVIDGIRVQLSHYPMVFAHSRDHDLEFADRAPNDNGGLVVCGHVHGLWASREREVNIGVDVRDYSPVSESALGELLRALPGYDPAIHGG